MNSKKSSTGPEQRELFQESERAPSPVLKPVLRTKDLLHSLAIPEDFTPLQRQVIETLRQPDVVEPSPKNPLSDRPETLLPARMLNEFVYCPRLFYYEYVEGIFRESEDTVRGSMDINE